MNDIKIPTLNSLTNRPVLCTATACNTPNSCAKTNLAKVEPWWQLVASGTYRNNCDRRTNSNKLIFLQQIVLPKRISPRFLCVCLLVNRPHTHFPPAADHRSARRYSLRSTPPRGRPFFEWYHPNIFACISGATCRTHASSKHALPTVVVWSVFLCCPSKILAVPLESW